MSETISQTIADYVQAMAQADGDMLREVLDPRASIVGNYEGATEWLSVEDFIHQLRSAEQGLQESQYEFDIIGIDKVGDTASVKLTTQMGSVVFCEYLSLLERERNWTITHKLYYLQG
ncbi:hypothetical protein ASF69_15700 [Rhizobium sp. Leaf311]|uniref:nuclear transport factor 2 family protein n=1 Tax=Rhizobium sp. Leaf311 TaxID=1736332 RepID=UPI000713D3DA|nr:nuclear transport factor 2 family protein [Rhizobium sp. Leaf311]KQQ58775.1 hypothetical protein ASF69_15700 [Rhizobium sp. Leaf311]